MKGSTILMIISVVMTVLGAIVTIVLTLGLLTLIFGAGAFGFIAFLFGLLPLAFVLFYAWSGYQGIQACRVGYGFERCATLGKILVGLQIVSVLAEFTKEKVNFGSMIVGSLIVGLYLYGALRAAEEEEGDRYY